MADGRRDGGRMILVTGATGRQGGAVARHLLDAGFRVRALTRDPNKPAARGAGGPGLERPDREPRRRRGAGRRTMTRQTPVPRRPAIGKNRTRLPQGSEQRGGMGS